MTQPIKSTIIIGWILWKSGLRPKWDTDGPKVFTTRQEAQSARGWMDTISPITATRLAEIKEKFKEDMT